MSYAGSGSSAPADLVLPRLWTPPLRDLDDPAASYGHDVITFAEQVLDAPLDPWEQWAAIHLGELLPDGRPRFRTLLLMVARQNGKSTLGKALVKYWLFVEDQPHVLGTSTDRNHAKRFWARIVRDCESNAWLSAKMRPVRLTTGEELMSTVDGAEYRFAANNSSAGRSDTISRWYCDELRQHRDFTAWDAAANAMNAVPYAQIVATTNEGEESAIVLDSIRDAAIGYLETGDGDPRIGLLEWSAPPGAEPDNREALRQANPSHRIDLDALVAAGRRAQKAGGLQLAGHRTEVMCQRVSVLDPAIDETAWQLCAGQVADLAQHRNRVACVLDVSLAGDHAALLAAAQLDGIVHVDVVAQWLDVGQLRRDLPDLIRRVRPRQLGWLPNGPAAGLLADLQERRRAGWPPRGTDLVPITSEVPAVCMALPMLVANRQLRHGSDPMLNAHVANGTRQRYGDRYVYARRGAGPVSGLYALAGAVHLARTMPPPPPALVAL